MKRTLDIRQGATFSLAVTARDDNGTVLNLTGLTGSSINFDIARYPDSTSKLTLTIGAGITLTTPASGIFTITMTAAQTAALDPGEYVHDCFVTVGGVAYEPLFGRATVHENIG